MSRATIRAILEGHVAALTPAWPTRWDNVAFKEPGDGTPWQSVSVLFADTRPLGMSADSGERWTGMLHITIWTPAGTGAQAAEARATLIRGDRAAGIDGHFYRGQTLASGTASVTILQPVERPPIFEPKWYGLPLLVPFFCNLG